MAERADAEFNILDVPIVGAVESAPTIFIDGAQGITLANEVAKIFPRPNLFQVIQDVSEDGAPAKRIIVARLAMSLRTLAQLTQWLSDNVKVGAQEAE